MSGAPDGALRVGVLGAGGRMGRMLVRTLARTEGLRLAAAADRPGSDALGEDAGALAGLKPLGVEVGADAGALMRAADVAIDFTSPAATAIHARLAAEAGTALVIGTTGLNGAAHEAIRIAAHRVPIVQSANTSVGVTLLLDLVRQVAATLDPATDIEILEMHHREKTDAPSGTALALGEAAAAGRGVPLGAVARRGRDGQTGARPHGEIGFASLRGGDVAGDHTVVFAAEGERIELTHRASDRALFARGAVRAALWVARREPGLYGMEQVLGLGG